MVHWYWLIVVWAAGTFGGFILSVIFLAALGGTQRRGDVDLTGRSLNGD